MRTRTALLITAAAIIAVGALENPAHAAVALWKDTPHWSIYGDTEQKVCFASSVFDAATLSLALTAKGDWRFLISNLKFPVFDGNLYDTNFTGSDGSKGVLRGVAVGQDQVRFDGLTPESVRNIGKVHALKIDGVGTFNMKGSAMAANEVWNCHLALTGRDA